MLIQKFQNGKMTNGIGQKNLQIGVTIGENLQKNIYIQNTLLLIDTPETLLAA